MRGRDISDWVRSHLTEIATATLTGFFTALMFRMGLRMYFSIVMGLALAYIVRIIFSRQVRGAIMARVAGRVAEKHETPDDHKDGPR